MNFFSYVSLLQRGLSLLRLIELRLFFALMAFTDPFQYLNHSNYSLCFDWIILYSANHTYSRDSALGVMAD